MKRIHVVAIDDVSDILDLIQYNLNKEGMHVDVFTGGSEALEFISESLPDIVISDWMMPAPDGLEVCKTLKSNIRTADIPIIMLTCKGDLQDYKIAKEAGASDYVAKPVRMEELIRRIKLLLPPEELKRAQVG